MASDSDVLVPESIREFLRCRVLRPLLRLLRGGVTPRLFGTVIDNPNTEQISAEKAWHRPKNCVISENLRNPRAEPIM
jgi:hypothetical protein